MNTVGLHPKFSIGALAGAATTILVMEMNRRGITLAPEEASAITVLITGLAAILAPSGNGNGADPGPDPVPAPAPVPAQAATLVPPPPVIPAVPAPPPPPPAPAAP